MLLVTVTTPPGTPGVLEAVAHALRNPDHYPPQAPGVWDVGVDNAEEFLGRFEALQSLDDVKRDLELTCTVCGQVLCDVEDGDELSVLAEMAAEHTCPGPWTAEAAAELSRAEAAFDAAGWRDPELADEIDRLAARRDWAIRHGYPIDGWESPVPDAQGRGSEIADL
jgi:hypothetical protein